MLSLGLPWGRHQKGSVMPIAAICFLVLAGSGAFAVDVGNFYYQKRRLQTAADLASMSAASNLATAEQAAIATLGLNGYPPSTLSGLEFGIYSADTGLAPSERFQPQTGSGGANAVRVTVQSTAPLILGGIFALVRASNPLAAGVLSGAGATAANQALIGTTSVAAQSSFASFAIGSSLLQINGGILNAVLEGLLGTNLALSVMDYHSLANTNIDLFAFSNALAARLNLTGLSFSQLAQTSVSVGDLISAAYSTTSANSQAAPGATAALGQIVAAIPFGPQSVNLGQLITYGPYGSRAVGSTPMTTTISLLGLVSGIAQIANGTNQIQVGLNATIPGLSSASLQLAIGERPAGSGFVGIGATGATVQTAQTRLLFTVQLVAPGVSSLVTVPLYIELAAGTAELAAISCSGNNINNTSVTLDVTPSIASAWIGTVPNSLFSQFTVDPLPGPATLLNVNNILTVTGSASAAITNSSATPVTFSYADIEATTVKTTSTSDFVSSLLSTLLGGLNLRVNSWGGSLGLPPGLNTTVATTIASSAVPMDALVAATLGALGVGLGDASTWVSGVSCGTSVLVN